MTEIAMHKRPWPQDDDIVELCITVPSLYSMASLQQVIELATDEIRDVPRLFESSQRCYGYRLSVHQPHYAPIDEALFFARCACLGELDDVTLRYIDAILAYNLGNQKVGYEQELWHDEEHPAGCFAIEPLAFRDARHVPRYAHFLLGNDMGHEVFQGQVIDGLIEKWGWRDETLELFAARCTYATGQGRHQIAELSHKYSLPSFLRQSDFAELLRGFLTKGILLKYSSHWGQLDAEGQMEIAKMETESLTGQPYEDVDDAIALLSESNDFPFESWNAPCRSELLEGLKAVQQKLAL